MRKKIARIIKVQRAKSELTQEAMSKKLGIKRANYARYELTGVIGADNLIRILLKTDIKKNELIDFFAECKEAMTAEETRKFINSIKESEDAEV